MTQHLKSGLALPARRSTEELAKALELALNALEGSPGGGPSTTGAAEFSVQETAYLQSGGLSLAHNEAADPVGQTAVDFAALISTSLPSPEVAKRLSVHPSNVRQMIMSRELYSMLIDRRRYVPQFQLTDGGALVRGIRQVNPALDETLHPVEVFTWYTTPNSDLVRDADETPISPLAWLRAGFPPEDVARLAAEL